jgi:hypothetical protein
VILCPGYIELDVFYQGKPLEGGEGVAFTYGNRFTSKADPDWTLKKVLKQTALSGREVEQLIEQETARLQTERASSR